MLSRRIVIAASGPSLTVEQAAIVTQAQRDSRCRVLVVNRTWERFPDADALYAGDWRFWHHYGREIRAGFRGALWTQDVGTYRGDRVEPWAVAGPRLGLRQIKSVPGSGLHHDPDTVYQLGNSGGAAIGLAVKRFAAQDIVLIGFDMQLGPQGEKHSHPDHPEPLTNGNPAGWVKHFDKLARDLKSAGIRCRNASLRTALRCFERVDLKEALR